MVFGRLFGRSKDPAKRQEPPALAETAKPGSAVAGVPPRRPPVQVTDEQRGHFDYLQAGIQKFGLQTLTSAALRELVSHPLADREAQLHRIVSHPDFGQSLNEIYDRNEQGENRLEVVKAFMEAFDEFGGDGFVSPGLQSVMMNKTGTARERIDRVFEHPDFPLALQRYDAHRAAIARTRGDPEFRSYIQKVEREAFGNPNAMLTFTDHRPRQWDGVRYKHIVHYRRIAGTMSDREKFVYLMAHVTQYYFPKKFDSDTVYNEVALRTTCALYGGGKGEQEWEVDPDYSGEKTDIFLTAAKERFDPWPVDKYFNEDAKTILDMHASDPDSEIARWGMAKLRPHSAGWATSR